MNLYAYDDLDAYDEPVCTVCPIADAPYGREQTQWVSEAKWFRWVFRKNEQTSIF